MNTFIGCDFGGTKLLIGEVDEQGNILQSKRYETGIRNHKDAANYILACLSDYMEAVGFLGTPVAAGTGVVGVVDYKNGIWKSLDHIETYPIPLADLLSKKLGVPVFIDNDVKCATRAEIVFGQGKHSENFIYINIGTGITAGIVVEGRILHGANNNSGEVGHSVIDMNREQLCICGRRGCVEGLASGTGFQSEVLRMYQEYETNLKLPKENEKVNISDIFRLSDEGDALCRKLTTQAVGQISNLIMNLVRITDPDTVILGGGMVSDGWLLSKIYDNLNASTMRGVTNGVKLSSLEPRYVGLIGAGTLGMGKIK